MTAEKRAALAKTRAEAEQQHIEKQMQNIVNKSGFIALNTQKGSARTYTEAEGQKMFNYDTEDQGTMVIHHDAGGSALVIKDTDGDAGDDALGVDTVIIKGGTTVIKE